MTDLRDDYHRVLRAVFVIGVSYNQPKFDPNATWNPNATTFAALGTTAYSWSPGIFINSNNTAYVTDPSRQIIQVWTEGSSAPVRNITVSGSFTLGIFVNTEEDIYMYDCLSYAAWVCLSNKIYKWTKDSSVSRTDMPVTSSCFRVFIDTNNTLYCSILLNHQVSKGSLGSAVLNLSITVGIGSNGLGPNELNYPEGIFVDTNFSLYVADKGNHRIQRFILGQSNGATVVGASASGTITLTYPSDVVLDGDGYLFIADTNNNRIVGSGPYGFRCLVGCFEMNGTASDQLFHPYVLAFDSHGNIFVSDTGNKRIQKFLLQNNTRGMLET